MSVSKAVRMALKKAGKQNADLAKLWGYTLNATSNKFQWERWTGKELSEVAEMTGGQLAFVYPDGTQITIPQEDTKKDAKAAAQRKNESAPVKPKAKTTFLFILVSSFKLSMRFSRISTLQNLPY